MLIGYRTFAVSMTSNDTINLIENIDVYVYLPDSFEFDNHILIYFVSDKKPIKVMKNNIIKIVI